MTEERRKPMADSLPGGAQKPVRIKDVARVALMTSELDPALIDDLAHKRVPVVFHNLGTAGEHMSNVLVDYAVGIDEAVRHLAALGHRQIAHVAGPDRFRSAVIRRAAYLASLARHVPEVRPTIYQGDFKFEGGRHAASEILAAGELPTAVVVAND